MTPTIVLRRDPTNPDAPAVPYAALGSPGGTRIIGTVLNALVQLLDVKPGCVAVGWPFFYSSFAGCRAGVFAFFCFFFSQPLGVQHLDGGVYSFRRAFHACVCMSCVCVRVFIFNDGSVLTSLFLWGLVCF